MSLTTLQLYSRQTNGETWADPTDPDYTVRFKTNATPKSLDGARTTNYLTEVIVNDVNNVTLNGKVVADALSVRIKTSGSVESIDQLKLMVKNAGDQLIDSWLDENVLLGFPPTTPPVRGQE